MIDLRDAQAAEVTAEQMQDLLVAIAPIVGTARVMSAAGHITEALGFAIAVAEEAGAMTNGKNTMTNGKKKK